MSARLLLYKYSRNERKLNLTIKLTNLFKLDENGVCTKENAQQFVRRTIHRLWHMLSECESRIGEMQEIARIKKKWKKAKSRKTRRWCCRLGVFVVHWCSANVFVFRRTHSAHRKHKMYLPTMALNWLKVVHNYNYITREWIREQERSRERERGGKTNMCPSASVLFIRQVTVVHIETESCGDFALAFHSQSASSHTIFFFTFLSTTCSAKEKPHNAASKRSSVIQSLCSHFVRYAIRNVYLLCCAQCGATTTVTVHHQKHREIYLCSFFLHFLCTFPSDQK